MTLGPERDFVGYGRNVPQIEWPNGARVALNLVLNYEEGSERSLAFGDTSNEGLGEVPRSVDPQYRDLATESVYEYGSRAGVFRLLRLFDCYGVRCTFFAAAQALERNPEVTAWLREAGHEPCGHGWRWSEDWLVDREEERARVQRAIDSITRTCGARPIGWYNRWMPSVHTRELLVELGFTYDSNAYNDDLPYYVETSGKPLLVIPYTLTYNDVRWTSVGGFGGPGDFIDLCRRGLDYLREEGETYPRMMSLGLHPRWTGQAGRASALRDFIVYALEAGDVWICRRSDIAAWWLEHYPPAKVGVFRS